MADILDMTGRAIDESASDNDRIEELYGRLDLCRSTVELCRIRGFLARASELMYREIPDLEREIGRLEGNREPDGRRNFRTAVEKMRDCVTFASSDSLAGTRLTWAEARAIMRELEIR
jgi:hypothetical protein